MPQRKESAPREVQKKEIVEHAYNAGMSTMKAMRALMPRIPADAAVMREFRNAQRELLLTARAFIDNQLSFLEHLDNVSSGKKKEEIKRVQVREKK